MDSYITRCPVCDDFMHRNGTRPNGKQGYKCTGCGRETVNPRRAEDIEIVGENLKLARQKQRYQDQNRIERKSFRNNVRLDTALEEVYKEYTTLLTEKQFNLSTKKHVQKGSETILVMQVSDCHFNELVDLPENTYDIEIAHDRLMEYVSKVFSYASIYLCDTVIVAFTGDQVNSDRRTDEMLCMAKPRAKAMFDAVDCFTDMMLMLNERFNVKVATVTGNESRLDKELGYSKLAGYQNYDFIIAETLKRIFTNKKGITFYDMDDPMEYVLNVWDKQILMIHDCPNIDHTKAKFADNGTALDYIIYGHKHEPLIGDTYARSGSLVGANGYSAHHMQTSSRASQNLHIVYKDDFIDTIKVDLQ